MKKDLRINVRINDLLKKRIARAKKLTGMPETLVVISCLEAYCSYVERHKQFTLPLAIVPRSELPDAICSGVSAEWPPEKTLKKRTAPAPGPSVSVGHVVTNNSGKIHAPISVRSKVK